MNKPSRRFQPAMSPQQIKIRLRGQSLTLAEASALAMQLHQLKNFPAVLEIYDSMLAKLPNSAEVHNNRGAVLQQLRRFDEALASYRKAVALKPDYANAHHNCGSLLKLLRRYDEALASYDRAVALNPGHAEAHNNRGAILMNKGEMAEAEQAFQKAIALKPDFAAPLFNLVSIRKYPGTDHADEKNLQALLTKPGLPLEVQEQIYYSLGKIYDDGGRYDGAFNYYRLANEIRNATVVYDPAAITRTANELMEVFSRDFLAQPSASASESRSPLFIVGMPRSGTTLLASILSNHRAIATAGELPTIAELTLRLPELAGSGISYPQAATRISSDAAITLAKVYEQRLRRDFGADVPHIIDKSPLNFWHLGFITRLFPQARIIHCTRDAMATGLSNYFQRFPVEYHYSFDLRNIGHFQGEYARLMAHWRKVLPRPMLEVSYEDMITGTEQVARTALDFLGLDWDERCLAPHTNPCVVETASVWQVRQPIYREAVEKWRHYEKHLAPLKEALIASGQFPELTGT